MSSEKRISQGHYLAGCFISNSLSQQDERGTFTKVIGDANSGDIFGVSRVTEIFYSRSQRSVIRGMHLQIPPYSGVKLVWLTEGRVLDVVVDLRCGSETFQKYFVTVLDSNSGAVVVPEGCAHGYEVLSSFATVCYAQSMSYSREHDVGIHWDSFGMEWTSKSPITSVRDRRLPTLSEFASPFTLGNNC